MSATLVLAGIQHDAGRGSNRASAATSALRGPPAPVSTGDGEDRAGALARDAHDIAHRKDGLGLFGYGRDGHELAFRARLVFFNRPAAED